MLRIPKASKFSTSSFGKPYRAWSRESKGFWDEPGAGIRELPDSRIWPTIFSSSPSVQMRLASMQFFGKLCTRGRFAPSRALTSCVMSLKIAVWGDFREVWSWLRFSPCDDVKKFCRCFTMSTEVVAPKKTVGRFISLPKEPFEVIHLDFSSRMVVSAIRAIDLATWLSIVR